MRFDGETFDEQQDGERLTRQLDRVHGVLADGRWHTLAAIAQQVGSSEAGCSARIRDLRKIRNGGHTVNRRRVPGASGLWEYKLVVAVPYRETLFA